MTNLHDETWTAEKDCVVDPTETILIPWDGRAAAGPEWQKARDRAQLAAAAPDMARVLLAIEWQWRERREWHVCPSCDGDETRDGEPRTGHRDNCKLDAALRKAGIR